MSPDPRFVPWLFDQLGRSQLLELLWDSLLWAVLGGIVGALLGLGLFFLLRALGGYRWEWRHAKWVRVLVAVGMLLGGAATGASIGVVDGALRGGERVLRESQLATEVFPVVGDAGADLLACLLIVDPTAAAGSEEESFDARLAAFRAGEWELNVGELFDHAEALGEDLAREQMQPVKESVLGRFPSWRGGAGERALEGTLVLLGTTVVTHEVEAKVDELGEVGQLAKHLVAGLPEAAARAGDPDTISHAELSAYLVQDGLVPVLLVPLEHFARGQQLTFALVAFALMWIPVALIRLAEYIRQRQAVAAPSAPPAPPAGPSELPAPPAAEPTPRPDP